MKCCRIAASTKDYTKPPRKSLHWKPHIVIFRALFGEASIHKKGKQQTCLQCICSVSLRVPSCHPRHRKMVHTNDTNLKKVFKLLMQIYTCLSTHSLEMVVEI
jgi:hypothetical protein